MYCIIYHDRDELRSVVPVSPMARHAGWYEFMSVIGLLHTKQLINLNIESLPRGLKSIGRSPAAIG